MDLPFRRFTTLETRTQRGRFHRFRRLDRESTRG